MSPRSAISYFYYDSIVNSYGQIFFSNRKTFAILLLIASFADPVIGLCGLCSLLISVILAHGLGLNAEVIRSGAYSYNSLMTGFVLGVYYQLNVSLFVVLLFGSGLTLLLTVWMSSWLYSKRLPYLSIPFILGVWIILLGARSFATLELSERGVYVLNEVSGYGEGWFLRMTDYIRSVRLPFFLDVYFKSLGAIIFQYNLISGMLVALGLLFYSRIAFSLSLIGFYSGYLFCYFIQGNLPELEFSYIGFNFILTAIALGGFFVISSWRSYLLVLLTMPLVTLLIIASGRSVFSLNLPIYSLPFSMIVILMMVVLGQRTQVKNLVLTQFQEFSPERNLYAHHTRQERFGRDTFVHIHLPFFGTWHVSQGHHGQETHKEDWRFAWDFVVTDDVGKTFRLPGLVPADFYCYGLPVLAPAAGYVVNILDGVSDNAIGQVNIIENWGNTIIIRHEDRLFSKLSHIKAGSFKVKVGDYVSKGDVLALVGNSGRSPEPHLHFQLQNSPHIGAATINYPLSYFVAQQGGKFHLHEFENPGLGQLVSKPMPSSLLKEAFRFVPGSRMKFRIDGGDIVEWEVGVDACNQSFIHCLKTDSYAWFINNDTLHVFINFQGDRKSLLYYFYLGANKVLLGYYPGLQLEDVLPLDNFYNGFSRIIQDFISPFTLYLKAGFRLRYEEPKENGQSNIYLRSSARMVRGNSTLRALDFEMVLSGNSITTFKITEGDRCVTAEFIPS